MTIFGLVKPRRLCSYQCSIKFNDLNYFLYNIASDHFHNAHQINQIIHFILIRLVNQLNQSILFILANSIKSIKITKYFSDQNELNFLSQILRNVRTC